MNRALLLTLLFVACGPESIAVGTPPTSETGQQQQVASTTGQPLTGFPCDVRAALQANCAGCHAGHQYYFVSFTTRDDLLQSIGSDTLGSEVARRLTPGAESPMPPTRMERQPTLEERQLIDGWIQSGMPAGACGPLTLP